jgi:hypothetical protein
MGTTATKLSRDDAAAERYRRAAQDALEQLDWCIGYLHGAGRTKVARALSRNRSFIRSELIRQPAEPLPVERGRGSADSAAHEPPRRRPKPQRPGRRTRPGAERAGRRRRDLSTA